MNIIIILGIIAIALFIYCLTVANLGKNISEEELKKLYYDSGLIKHLDGRKYQNIINVSRNIVNNAKTKKEEYVWKYFYKEKDDDIILEELESIEKEINEINLNANLAYEKAKAMKEEYYKRCMDHLIFKFPCSKMAISNWDLIKPINKTYDYIFHYTSPQGRSQLEVKVPFDYSIKSFIINKIEYKNSAKG